MHRFSKFLLLSLTLLSLCSFSGCATTGVTGAPGTSQAVASAQDAASKSLYAIGTALQVTPQVLDALYNAGKISKAQYNSAVPVYNQALASFNLAVSALKAAISAGQDPAGMPGYVTALQMFMTDKANADNILAALGKQTVGTGVAP